MEGAPIVFTATGLNPAATAAGTRAPVDGNWEGVQSVGVLMGGTVKEYAVTASDADGYRSATLSRTDDPFYWTSRNDITVTAWWPYTEGETTPPAVKVRQDQSTRDGFEGSDFIAAEEQAVTFDAPKLTFTHRTARVTVALTNRPEESMNVRLTGLSTENGNPAVIAPYNKGGDTWSALVAPQTVAAGTAIITCTFTSGKSFVYRMQKAAEWKAGEEYTYTVSLVAADPVGYTYDEATNTYTVYNANGLLAWNEAVQSDLTLNCTLAADINMTGIDWTPIGTRFSNSYTGTFDGGNHTITGLTINLPDQDYVGMFGRIGRDGTVKNVALTDVKVTGRNYVGGVVGYNYTGTLYACYSTGTVTGSGFSVGGVVGENYYGTLYACYATGNVTGILNVGGVVGHCYGTLTACYAAGDVSGKEFIGGVVGRNSGTLTACYAAGDVSGNERVGGVAGSNTGTLTACYWSNYDGSGIGEGSSGDVTKVDGTTVTWIDAQSGMNAAIDAWNGSNPDKQCNWHYAETDAETPPTLEPND